MNFCKYRTVRSLVLSGMIVSLSLSGLLNEAMVWADSGVFVSAAKQATQCCCGTESGFC